MNLIADPDTPVLRLFCSGQFREIPLEEIAYIQANGTVNRIYTTSTFYRTHYRLGQLATMLPRMTFFRINKSCIIPSTRLGLFAPCMSPHYRKQIKRLLAAELDRCLDFYGPSQPESIAV